MATQRIGYFDDGELRAGTGRYLAEIIGALDRTRFEPLFFAPRAHPWHDDLRRLDVEMVYSADLRQFPWRRAAHGGSTGRRGGDHRKGSARQRRVRAGRRPYSTPRRRKGEPRPGFWATLRTAARNARLFRRRSVDPLHSNNTGAETAPIAARLARVPRIVGTLHVLPSYDLDGLRSGLRDRLLEKTSMRALDHVIACCDAARREWHARCGLPAGKVTVIHNGIRVDRVARTRAPSEARALLDLPPDAFIAVTMGNLHRYKGQEFLLRAVPALIASHPKMLVAIAGAGSSEGDLRRLVEELGIGKHVRLLGFCSEVGALLDAADLYVQSSLVEAFPISTWRPPRPACRSSPPQSAACQRQSRMALPACSFRLPTPRRSPAQSARSSTARSAAICWDWPAARG